MKRPSKRPHRLAFLRKWWQLIIMMLAFVSAEAQSDSARYSPINGYGFRYKRFGIDSVFMIPFYESNHTPYRAGALKYRRSDSSLYKYTGTQWLKVESSGSTAGIDTVYTMDDTVQVIETPTETYFTIINSPYTEVINDSTIVIGNDTLVIKGGASGGGGVGSVTSISQGYGIVATPNPITSTGTIRADTSGTNGLVTRTELLDSTDITTQVESPIYVKLRASWPVPDTLALDSTIMATRARAIKISDSVVANRVKYSDTATMLTPYLRKADTTAMLTPYLNDAGWGLAKTGKVVRADSNAVASLWNVNNGGKTWPDEKPLGIIYEKSQWSDISGDLLPNPTGSNLLSISTGYLNSSAAAFSYNNYVRILPGRPTDMNRWKMTVRFRNTAWSANSFEFGVGIYSAVTHSGAAFGYIAFLQTTSSGSGNLFIYDQSGAVQRATGSGTVTYALNDEIELIYTYNDSVLTFTAQNITTGGTLRTATYTFPNNMSVILPNNGNWGLFEGNGGTGTHQVRYIKIESLETQYPNLLIIGNSKTKGYYASSYADRFAPQLNATYPTVVWNAGSAERLTDMLTRIDEFTQLNGSQVWMVDAASNQLRAGTSIADTWVMYDQLTRALEGGGATVLHSVLPEDSTGGGLGQTAWNALINSRYPGRVIDLYAAMSSGNIGTASMLHTDKVHLSQLGNNTVVSTGISSGLLTTISTQRRAPYRVHDDVVKFTGDSLHFKWKVRSRGNYVPRWSTNLDELTTGPLYMDSLDVILSNSTRPTKPLSTMKLSVEGAIATYGNQGTYMLFDRTTPSNYYGFYSDNSILRFIYSGTDRAYLNTIGSLRLGNTSSPIISGMLQIKNNQTLAGTLGRLGINLNIDTTVTTAPNTGHSFFAANSIGPHSVISTSSGNTTTAANLYIDDSVVASTNHVFLGTSYAVYINKGKTRLGTTDSVGTATGGFLFKDFATGDVRLTAAPAGVTQSALDDTAAAIRADITTPVQNYEMFYSDNSSTTVGNTTTEATLLGTGTGTAQFTGATAGCVLSLKGSGVLSTAGSAGVPTLEFTISNYTAAHNLTGLTGSLTNVQYNYDFEIIPVSIGTNQDAIVNYTIRVNDGASGKLYAFSTRLTASFTSSGTLSVDVTADWDAADAANTLTSYKNIVQIFRK